MLVAMLMRFLSHVKTHILLVDRLDDKVLTGENRAHGTALPGGLDRPEDMLDTPTSNHLCAVGADPDFTANPPSDHYCLARIEADESQLSREKLRGGRR
jgi:hypothetical protein